MSQSRAITTTKAGCSGNAEVEISSNSDHTMRGMSSAFDVGHGPSRLGDDGRSMEKATTHGRTTSQRLSPDSAQFNALVTKVIALLCACDLANK